MQLSHAFEFFLTIAITSWATARIMIAFRESSP